MPRRFAEPILQNGDFQKLRRVTPAFSAPSHIRRAPSIVTRERLLRKDMLSVFERNFRDLMMQRMNREVIHGIDRSVLDHLAIIGKDCDFCLRLEIAEILFFNGQRIARDIRNRLTLLGSFATLHVALRVLRFSRTERRDSKIIEPPLRAAVDTLRDALPKFVRSQQCQFESCLENRDRTRRSKAEKKD